MPDPLAVLSMRRFKAQLLARDAEQMRIMARQWTGVERQLDAHISALAREIDEKRRNGEIVSQTRLYQLQRYKSLKAQTEEEFSRYANWATTEVTEQQRALAKLGLDHGARAIGDVYAQHGMVGTFDRLPVQAAENMAGLAGDGRPVGVLLKNRINPHYSDERALSAWTNLTDTLVRNTALGINPRETAEAMRDDLAGGLQKGLTIARTEQLRVYRQANQQQYQESGVVSGHKRLCDHTDRTCIACLADEGTLYPVTEPIFDHPAGRCTSVPVVKGLPELQFETGEEWLSNMDDEDARKIMGNERYEAWKDGTPMKDFITYTDHPTWGRGLTPTPASKLSKVTKPPVVGEFSGSAYFSEDIGTATGRALGSGDVAFNKDDYRSMTGDDRKFTIAHEVAHQTVEPYVLSNQKEWDLAEKTLTVRIVKDGPYEGRRLFVFGQTRIGEAVSDTLAVGFAETELPASVLSAGKATELEKWVRGVTKRAGYDVTKLRQNVKRIKRSLDAQL